MSSNDLFNVVLAGLADPANYLAVASGPDAIKARLRMGISPLVLGNDWFHPEAGHDKETQILALNCLMQQIRLAKVHPDSPVLACGAPSLLAAATRLHRYGEMVELLEGGADPHIMVDPSNPNPRARTLIGSAMTGSVTKPEDWLSYFMAFGSYSQAYAHQMGHYQLHAQLDRDLYGSSF